MIARTKSTSKGIVEPQAMARKLRMIRKRNQKAKLNLHKQEDTNETR